MIKTNVTCFVFKTGLDLGRNWEWRGLFREMLACHIRLFVFLSPRGLQFQWHNHRREYPVASQQWSLTDFETKLNNCLGFLYLSRCSHDAFACAKTQAGETELLSLPLPKLKFWMLFQLFLLSPKPTEVSVVLLICSPQYFKFFFPPIYLHRHWPSSDSHSPSPTWTGFTFWRSSYLKSHLSACCNQREFSKIEIWTSLINPLHKL